MKNLPKSLSEKLRLAGHDAIDLREIGKNGISDREVMQIANQKKRFLITADYKHFANILLFPPESLSCGIIVVKMSHYTLKATVENILRAISSLQTKRSKLFGSLIIIESDRIRLRK